MLMSTAERLQSYYDFSEGTIEAVEKAAALQNPLSFDELAKKYEIQDGPQLIKPSGHKEIDILWLKPDEDYDETQSRVYHLPMGNALSESMIMRGLRLFETDKSKPLMLVRSEEH